MILGKEIIHIEVFMPLKLVYQLWILNSENVIVSDDFDEHIGSDNHGFKSMHGGYGFRHKYEVRESILEFALAYDLCISNAFFMKSEEHLLTFKSGENRSQIDFFLMKKNENLFCKNFKVILADSISTQN